LAGFIGDFTLAEGAVDLLDGGRDRKKSGSQKRQSPQRRQGNFGSAEMWRGLRLGFPGWNVSTKPSGMKSVHSITAGGKTLRDHLEAVDHYSAVLWMRELAGRTTAIDGNVVRELHRRIVARSQPEIGGIYSRLPLARAIPAATPQKG
jgi:hypothetical protein